MTLAIPAATGDGLSSIQRVMDVRGRHGHISGPICVEHFSESCTVSLPSGLVTRIKKHWHVCHISGILARHYVRTNKRNPTMTTRLDLFAAASSLMKEWQRAMFALDAASSLGSSLSELVKIRASQINGCANCINLHTTEARENGETEQRVYLLSAWREAPCYTDRERAALGWTEALTRLSEEHMHASAYEALKAEFTEEEQVKLTLMINIINGYNRLAVGFGGWVDPAVLRSAAKVPAA
jgi:AhpD family alkylhydroperoxidase